MALRRPTTLLTLAPTPTPKPPSTTCHHCRHLHRLNAPTPRIPRPTPFVPDAQTFLTLIGRNMSSHASKIPTWEALFSLSSQQLRDSGVEPARARRYLLWWRERFRNGITGIGGDLTSVRDGVAELRVKEVKSERRGDREATVTRGAGMRRVVVNVEPTVVLPVDPAAAAPAAGARIAENVATRAITKAESRDAAPVAGVRIVQASAIAGKGVEAVKGHQGVARLRVQEGLWEQRRGHKVDGGERRKAEVRYKRRAAERKNAR